MSNRLCQKALSQLFLTLLMLVLPGPARADGFQRIHLNVADPQAAALWYVKNLDGRATSIGSTPAVAFRSITITFARVSEKIPGSVGSGIDHLGFSYADLDAAMDRFARSGVKIVSGIEKDGPVRYAFIHDPWSTLIEVVEDREIRGFHHLHLATTDPKATLRWYTDVFGGKIARFAGLIGGIRYGDTWVLVKGVKRPPARTQGRAIDHVGWTVSNRDATVKKLGVKNARFESDPRGSDGSGGLFFASPDGVRLAILNAPRSE